MTLDSSLASEPKIAAQVCGQLPDSRLGQLLQQLAILLVREIARSALRTRIAHRTTFLKIGISL
jgi:hypothetical protein